MYRARPGNPSRPGAARAVAARRTLMHSAETTWTPVETAAISLTRIRPVLRTMLLFARFGPKAIAEIVLGQINAFTEPRTRLARCGKRTYFNRRCSIEYPEQISVGEAVIFGAENRLWASPGAMLIVEDEALIGPNVTIVTSNHGTADRNLPIQDQPWLEADVVLGRRCWIGANVVILPGVTIGEGAVVAAGAVVTTSVPPFAIVAGVPARLIKYRDG